jgi:hypothetical protein|nr:MAG: hypothetical protein DIU61_18795 [Bacteroidota bacterium]
MKKLIRQYIIPVLVTAVLFWSCTETEFDKVLLPSTEVAGEYVVTIELPALDITDVQHIKVFNTSSSFDSLWIEDPDFFETQVKVKLNSDNTFGITNGVDIFSGISVDITGKVFPEKDSIHIEWLYKDVDIGLGEDDYQVIANGVLYDGLD